MDKLEQFIIDNKGQFDEPRKPEEGWDKIQKKLDRKQPDWTVYWKVAAVVFFISSLVLATLLMTRDVNTSPVLANQPDTFEDFYFRQINQKMSEYTALVDASQRDELFQDLADFDSAYSELRASFEDLQSEEIAEAMLENLRLRILILNEQIELIRRGRGQEEFYHSS